MASDNKYDRQLRLWGSHGQRALMEARILLVGSGATGTEALKNLVLPGVGHITVLDDALVAASDLGNNFFVGADSLGRPRAEVTCELLLEMNSEDVGGEARVASLETVLAEDPQWLAGFTLVIATQLAEGPKCALAAHLWAHNVPLLLPRSYGLIGYVRVVAPEHCVVESKPDGDQTDLRVVNPFPELEEYCRAYDLASLDDMEHKHVPYVVLLWSCLQAWKAEHDGEAPGSFAAKEEFKAALKAMARDYSVEDNFQEAMGMAYRGYVQGEVSGEVQEVLDDARCTGVTAESSAFWVCAAALRAFVASEGVLPVSGEVPDMTSTTAAYTRLQAIYQAKAAADRAAITAHVATVLAGVGKPADTVSEEFVTRFCKNANNLLALKLRSVDEELGAETANGEEVMMAQMIDPSPMNPIQMYLMLRLADRFQLQEGRFPGVCEDAQVAADAAKLAPLAAALREELGVGEDMLTPDHCAELARYGACEVHNIAALVGGVASQEAVKIITKQYVPVNNTFVYNGISAIAGTWEL